MIRWQKVMIIRQNGVEGLIFDLDGTLIRSRIDFVLMRQLMTELLQRYDLPPGTVDPKDTMTGSIIRAWSHLSAQSSEATTHQFAREVDQTWNQVEMVAVEGTTEVPGARSTLGRLRRAGYPLGILTRSSRRYTMAALESSGLDDLIDAMVCRDDHDMIEAKPNPIAMHRAAALIRVRTERCVYIGDHHMDLECAAAAGSAFIAVLSGSHDEERWRSYHPDVIINSVAELPSMLARRS
jgi:HAD superfamily hydrolase (TIGR01549 family)